MRDFVPFAQKHATILKVTQLQGCFFMFFKLYIWYQITKSIINEPTSVNRPCGKNSNRWTSDQKCLISKDWDVISELLQCKQKLKLKQWRWFMISLCLVQIYSIHLTLSWRRSLSYKNQSIDLLCKSMDWFLYDRDHHHERVNTNTLTHFMPLISFYTPWNIRKPVFWCFQGV